MYIYMYLYIYIYEYIYTCIIYICACKYKFYLYLHIPTHVRSRTFAYAGHALVAFGAGRRLVILRRDAELSVVQVHITTCITTRKRWCTSRS